MYSVRFDESILELSLTFVSVYISEWTHLFWSIIKAMNDGKLNNFYKCKFVSVKIQIVITAKSGKISYAPKTSIDKISFPLYWITFDILQVSQTE